jgi:predicted ATPase
LLAEVSIQTDRVATGLEALAEALRVLATNGGYWWEAELHRLTGELLLAQRGTRPRWGDAEANFHQALAIARRQQAKSLELRAAMSLAHLWQRQGKRAAAYELLAPIYGWFSEGFNTTDLRQAKALLAELG